MKSNYYIECIIFYFYFKETSSSVFFKQSVLHCDSIAHWILNSFRFYFQIAMNETMLLKSISTDVTIFHVDDIT